MRFIGHFAVLCTLCLGLMASRAEARTVEPGAITVSGGIGPGIRLGSRLGGSRAYLLVFGQGEYNLTKNVSLLGGVQTGISGTLPLQLQLGGRYRLTELDLPISPYAQAQIVVGRLYGVIGDSNLTTLGVRGGLGADYFLTAQFAAGGLVAMSVGSTVGQEAAAFYGSVDILAYAAYTF